MATVIIGADICPIEDNRSYFMAGDADSLFHDLLPEMKRADLTIANLECPLIESPSPIPKTGPTFGEPTACINGIEAGGLDVLCLANNHIMDHGAPGLRSTLDVCARTGIATVGAGENLEAARRLLIRKAGDIRIAILAVAEHEFSVATPNAAGANPLDMIEFVRVVKRHRDEFDYLIVLLHGSAEFHVPTPRIQDTCRFMIEMGAGAVVVQHPHVLGGCEQYLGGHIVYGQGALVMDEAVYRSRKTFHEGFLVKLTLSTPSSSRMDLIPFIQSDPVPGARRMQPDHEQRFRNELDRRSNAIQDAAFVHAEWLKYCTQRKYSYLSSLLGHNRIVRKLNARGWFLKLLYPQQVMLGVRNVVRCETHREAVETIFNLRLL